MRLIGDHTVALAMASKQDAPDAVAAQTGLSRHRGLANNLDVPTKTISWLDSADGHTRTTQTNWARGLLNADTQGNPWSPRRRMLNIQEAKRDFCQSSSCKRI